MDNIKAKVILVGQTELSLKNNMGPSCVTNIVGTMVL